MDPEAEFLEIEKQVFDLARQVFRDNPGAGMDELAEKIMETWHSRPYGADRINLIEVKPGIIFKIGFWKEEKRIIIDPDHFGSRQDPPSELQCVNR